MSSLSPPDVRRTRPSFSFGARGPWLRSASLFLSSAVGTRVARTGAAFRLGSITCSCEIGLSFFRVPCSVRCEGSGDRTSGLRGGYGRRSALPCGPLCGNCSTAIYSAERTLQPAETPATHHEHHVSIDSYKP